MYFQVNTVQKWMACQRKLLLEGSPPPIFAFVRLIMTLAVNMPCKSTMSVQRVLQKFTEWFRICLVYCFISLFKLNWLWNSAKTEHFNEQRSFQMSLEIVSSWKLLAANATNYCHFDTFLHLYKVAEAKTQITLK